MKEKQQTKLTLCRTSLNDVNGHPFAGFKVKMVGDGNILDCSPIQWDGGVPGDTGTRACS